MEEIAHEAITVKLHRLGLEVVEEQRISFSTTSDALSKELAHVKEKRGIPELWFCEG